MGDVVQAYEEPVEAGAELRRRRYTLTTGDCRKPVACAVSHRAGIAAMGRDIHAVQVRYESLIPVLLHVKNQAAFMTLVIAAETLRTKEYAEF